MQRSHGRWAGVVGLVALVLTAVASIVGQLPPPARGGDASAADFSAGRAMAHVQAVAAADFEVKGGGRDPVYAVERCVLTITGQHARNRD